MIRLACLGFAGAMLAVAPAKAEIVTITAEGTVDLYADGSLRLFGVPASTLFGAPMEEVFTFDLSKGTIFLYGASGWYRSGSGSDTLGPAVVTVGGHVQNIDGSRLSNFSAGTAVPDTLDAYTSEDTGTLLTSAEVTVLDQQLVSGGLVYPGTYALTPGQGAMNLLAETDCGLSVCPLDEFGSTLTSITLAVSAPEPSTWALMISGFGAIGAMMRRRPRAARRSPASS